MITFLTKPYPEDETLGCLHPLVKEWFLSKFRAFSPPQRFSIKNIHDGKNTLISSPTGSGKTLSAFLSIINHLVMLEEQGALEEKVYCVYVSPLKALANDITKNLKEPLEEMKALAKRRGKKLHITVATRTGDTSASKKAGMLKKPPHILITTPESLAIILTTIKFREMLRTTRFLIIDEIHALAENKRGVHLNLTLERLEALVNNPETKKPETKKPKAKKSEARLVRIGLSATVSPLEEVAKFLVGLEYPCADGREHLYRDCDVIDVQAFKKHDLKVLCPVKDLMRASHAEMQAALYEELHNLIQAHKTTLVFTNTRAATERVVHNLKARYPQHYHGILDGDLEEEEEALEQEQERELREEGTRRGLIGAHHGSLSKSHRHRIEEQLRRGELKAVVCSTSLELGIDIGSIDLVVLLGSPKSVARGLQRIGRAGHQLHETAKGRIIVLDRDDMVECAVLLKSAIERKIDCVRIPKNCLDVLAQQLFSMAIEKVWQYEDLYWTVRKSFCYADLSKEDFEAVLAYLAGEYALEDRHVYAKIWWDRETGEVGKRGKLARLIALTNTGTIPDETRVKVKIGEQVIGSIDEAFLERLNPGDVFVLGGETYEFRYSRGMTAQVKSSVNRPPTVPRWASEMLPLSYDLALEIGRFREYMNDLLLQGREKEAILAFMREYLYADERTLNSIHEYFREQYAYSQIPHRHRIILERFRDGNKRHVIVHSLYGRRVNDVLSRALAYALGKIHKRDVAMTITDTGFALTSTIPLNTKRAFALLKSGELRRVMEQALEKSQVLARRFRHCATRSLMILRTYKGNTKSAGKQQMNSRLLYNAVKRISNNFPVLKEARREVLEDLMDIKNAIRVLKEVEHGAVKIVEVATALPSPFAFNIILRGYSDILKMEDRVAFLKRMHRMILDEIESKGSAKAVMKKAESEKSSFSYEALWRKAEEKRISEQDEKHERLKREVWNLPRVPLYAREEIVKVIDGSQKIRPDVEEALEQHKNEIVKSWSPELVTFLFERLGIAYDEAVLEREAEKRLLRRQLAVGARKRKVDDELRKDFERLIDGEELENKERFWAWAREEFTGTVHKAWADEIVKWVVDKFKTS